MYALSRDEMSQLDKLTLQEYQMSSEQLMETAGKACSESIIEIIKPKIETPRFLILCGTGNNGGDGFVIARWLMHFHYHCQIILLGDPNKMSPETFKNYTRCQKLKITVRWIESEKYLEDLRLDFNVLIDAVYGIGFKGSLSDFHKNVFSHIQPFGRLTIAIDIPSGIDADNGLGVEEAIRADFTLAIASPKRGHYLNRGKDHSGIISVIDIGIPDFLYEKQLPEIRLISEDNIRYPERYASSHKGDYGRIAILAGSPGLSGAAILASKACLRAGGGLITLFHRRGMNTIFESQLIEVMKKEIPETDNLPHVSELITLLEDFDAILLGPGIGKDAYAESLLKAVLSLHGKPVIIDADGINLLSEKRAYLSELANKPILLTPHMGEFARLLQIDMETLSENPPDFLRSFIDYAKVPVLLKSSTTFFADNESMNLISKGNDGLSTGGSGDVLAGIIASFIAQNTRTKQKKTADGELKKEEWTELFRHSAISSVWLLGETAEYLAKIRRTPSVIPSDIIEHLFVL